MDEFREAAAKAFFGSAWADQCEEAGESSMLSGAEILNVMPDKLDPEAVESADYLAHEVERLNGASLDSLLERIAEIADGDREPTAEMFGHYAAMQAMGHGVGLGDAFGSAAREMIKLPYIEFSGCSLSRAYFETAEDDDDE